MPSMISHMLLGQRILAHPPSAMQRPETDRIAFLWGSQGPDILFRHRLLPWQKGSLRSFGGKLHAADPTALFQSVAKVCRYCRGKPDFPQIYSYALGFCCHYCYDRRTHPLVYYNIELMEKTDERGQGYNYHAEIESNLDIMLLRHETGRLMQDFRLTDCLPEENGLDDSIALFYALLLCDLFGIHTPRWQSATLGEDFRMWTALLDDAHAVKKPLARTAERLLPHVPLIRGRFSRGSLVGNIHGRVAETGFDYGNLLGNTWFNPDNRSERSHFNFYELTDIAETETRQLIGLLAEETEKRGSVDFADFTKGLDFSGRRHCADMGKYSRPFPYEFMSADTAVKTEGGDRRDP